MKGGDGDFPARRIGGAAGSFPLVEWYDGEVGGLKWGGGSFGWDKSSGGGKVGSIAWVAHAVEHEFVARVELKAEPVPSFLIFPKCAGGKFVIEPREALDGNFFTADRELACGLESGERVVVAGIAWGGGFSAEAFLALQGERFEWGGGEFESDARGGVGGDHLQSGVGFSLKGPAGESDLHIFLGNFYLTECATAEFFGEDEASRLNIGDGEMSEVDVTD